MTSLWGALAPILLLLALLTAAATAVRSVSRIWLRHWAEHRLVGSGSAEAYIDRPQRLLLGATTGAALLVVGAGLTIGASTPTPLSLVVELALFGAVMLVVAQSLPRVIGRRWATVLVPVLLPMLRGVSAAMTPVVRAAQAVARAAVTRPGPGSPPTERDEIEDLLREGELEGIGEKEEIDFITDVIQFGEKRLRDVMTPRTEVFAIDVESDPSEAARAIAQAGYSRVPVYRGSLDEVVGLVHAFDVLVSGGERMPALRQVAFAPAAKPCSEMLFEMLRGQRHLAVVLDEFGGMAGIVTLEDVLEEIVGDIRDEHDEPAAVTTEMPRPTLALLLPGATDLREVEERFGVSLGSERENSEANTLGGALVRALGRIPVAGERFRLGGLEATVVESDATRVVSLLLQPAGSAVAMDVALPA
ncbi:MAG: hemolysin family protein [Gemmatimonadota bacterium]|nr:hemolysin family protein [Gemmatimonadota bacterium]